MDGIHDMGGMHGFGPVEPEAGRARVPRAVGGPHLRPGAGGTSAAGLRAGRHPPGDRGDPTRPTYLASSYYERWARSTRGRPRRPRAPSRRPRSTRRAATVAAGPTALGGHRPGHGGARPPGSSTAPQPTSGDAGRRPRSRWATGSPCGAWRRPRHHRCPRYVRGVTGTVDAGGRRLAARRGRTSPRPSTRSASPCATCGATTPSRAPCPSTCGSGT